VALTVADERAALARLRLRMVWVALALGWVSAGVVVAGALLPVGHRADEHPLALWGLVTVAVVVNGVLGLLPWRSLVASRFAGVAFGGWAVAVAGLVAAFVRLQGGWRSDDYLLYFLLVPFVAITEDLAEQVLLDAVIVGSYVVAVLLGPPPPVGVVVVRLVAVVAVAVVSSLLAAAIARSVREQVAAEATARLERLLADEAHHRIKNNLQLVADLLSLEAGKDDSSLAAVVEETVARIQSVAAVHQSLATRATGLVELGPVVGQIARLLGDRLAGERRVEVHAAPVVLDAQRATWTAIVVNELVTNALRHGSGCVRVAVGTEEDAVVLTVDDEGPSEPLATAIAAGASREGLGLTLVSRIVEDGLSGTLVASPPGESAGVTIRFRAGPPAMPTHEGSPRRREGSVSLRARLGRAGGSGAGGSGGGGSPRWWRPRRALRSGGATPASGADTEPGSPARGAAGAAPSSPAQQRADPVPGSLAREGAEEGRSRASAPR
jgi:two-component sensor histidine kinase